MKIINKIKKFFLGLKIEIKQSMIAWKILNKKNKTKYQKKFLREQSLDVLKGFFLLLILILPGSAIMLTGLIKFFGKKLFPTAFQ